MKNRKGFTLIELLAVVIILGILMTVGGVAVTRIVENTRKNTFINTAQNYAEAVRTLWMSDSLFCGSQNIISSTVDDGDYYILIDSTDQRFNYLLENNNKSPWGNRNLKGYVKVNVSTTNKGHKNIKYYVSITDGIHALKDNKESDTIKKGDLIMNVSKDQATLDAITKVPFDGNSLTTCGEAGLGTDQTAAVNMVTGDINNPQVGDIFSIKNERFYVISSTHTTITGLAEYNLYVGGEWSEYKSSYRDYGAEATGKQNSEMRGFISDDAPSKGVLYNNNSYTSNKINNYLSNYKSLLEAFGVNINEVRLLTFDELTNIFNCYNIVHQFNECPTTYPWLYQTTSYLGDEITINTNRELNTYSSNKNNAGIRPVITINKKDLAE